MKTRIVKRNYYTPGSFKVLDGNYVWLTFEQGFDRPVMSEDYPNVVNHYETIWKPMQIEEEFA
jgi:hypothetical protein